MVHTINGVPVDAAGVETSLRGGNLLAACKHLQEKTGCSLAAARKACDDILRLEDIEVDLQAVEMQEFLLAEYRCGDEE